MSACRLITLEVAFSSVARLTTGIVIVAVAISACSRDQVRVPAPIAASKHISVVTDPGVHSFARTPIAIAEWGKLHRTIRAVGVIRPDERRVHRVQIKIGGWVEKLFVNSTGESVNRGSPMLALYSPELLASQEEYLGAREAAAKFEGSESVAAHEQAAQVVAAARRRLELFDVPARFVRDLAGTGHARRAVTLLAPASGVVIRKDVFVGQRLEPGADLYVIADLTHVWIEAAVSEADVSAIRVGQAARIDVGENARLNGQVAYIAPYLDANTRTLSVRFDFPNPQLALKLDAYVSVEFSFDTPKAVIVPSSAVLDTGLRRFVFVDTGGARFEPRIVRVGVRSDGRTQILDGVTPGERVAIKANFLVDSESRLRDAL